MDARTLDVDGRRLAVRDAGAGPVVCYLHDAGADTARAPVLHDLARDHRVIGVDLPGYGGSDPPGDLADARAMAAVLIDLLDHLDATPAVVAGTSLGGWFALEMALASPQAVCGLVVCGAAGLHVPEEYLFALFTGGAAAAVTQDLIASALRDRLAPTDRDVAGLAPALAAAIVGPHVANLAAAAACSWDPFTANPRLVGRLGGVRCPTVVLHGEHDALVPLAHGRLLAAVVPGARLHVLPGGGHLVPLEAPAAFATAVRAVSTAC